MKRIGLLTLCAVLVLAVSPAEAKKKHKKHRGLGPVVTVTAPGNVSPTSEGESIAVATCPHGKQVIGGGFSAAPVSASALVLVHDSYRSSAQSWTVLARRLGSVGSANATAYAYCRNSTKSAISDSTQTASLTGTLDAKNASATCPAGTRLVAGGFQSTVGAPANDFVIIQQNAPSSGAWSVTAVNDSNATESLTAHAYCLAGIRPPTILSQTNTATVGIGGALTSTSGACPRPPKPKKGKKKGKKKPAQLLSAGGFSGPIASATGPALLWSDSLIASPGWKASATNLGSSTGSVSITSYGVCV